MSRQRSGRTSESKDVSIYYGEIELNVLGDYIEGDKGDMWTAPTGSDLEQVKIIYNGMDVTDLLTEILPDATYQELVNKAIEQIESEL